MVRILKKEYQNDDVNYYEFAGLSTDTKPVAGVCTGSKFIEVDTGDTYLFNEEGNSGEEWIKVTASGGGSNNDSSNSQSQG